MQKGEKFVIRMPDGMRDQVRRNAEANRRTMNAEIIHYIDRGITEQERVATTGSEFGDLTPSKPENNSDIGEADVRTDI